jgi:glutamine amidotransferase
MNLARRKSFSGGLLKSDIVDFPINCVWTELHPPNGAKEECRIIFRLKCDAKIEIEISERPCERRTTKMTIVIVDYGMGNLFSIYNALDYVGGHPKIVRDTEGLDGADGIVVPGVGAFGSCMSQLSRFESCLLRHFQEGIPMLGICVGMQVLFEESEESPGVAGMGWIGGKVVRLPDSVMIPQMGWNSLSIKRSSEMLDGIQEGDMFYFVHSYYGQPEDGSLVLATVEHGVAVTAALEKDNLFATQFHPEKSGARGLRILENFVRSTRC